MHIKLNVKKKKFESFSSWEQKKTKQNQNPFIPRYLQEMEYCD